MACERIIQLINDIHYGRLFGSYEIVIATVSVFKEIITNSECENAQQLMDIIKLNGEKLVEAIPEEPYIGNMVRKILKIIREEHISESKNKSDKGPQTSLDKFIKALKIMNVDFTIPVPTLKNALIDSINEFEMEVESCKDNIAEQASKLIHSNAVILTIGKSRVVEEFFKNAAATRNFEVIVAESSPSLTGHEMANNLAKSKIKTTLISDAAVFAMMPIVSKVIISAHSVLANAGLRAVAGTHMIAKAAKHYNVPVIVLMPLYKLTSLYYHSYDQEGFNRHISPLDGVIDSHDFALLEKVQTFNPTYDYVPPNLVELFISNNDSRAAAYVYRWLSEYYHPDDEKLD